MTARGGGPVPRVLPDLDAVVRAAARGFADAADAAARAGHRFRVALAGGSTPRGAYALLAGEPLRDRIPWDAVRFFFGDERTVPPDDEASNYRMAREALFDRIPLRPGQVHRLRGEARDLDAAASDYEMEIAREFGARPGGPPPAFDLVWLGLGPDGHTASLFPGTRALAERHRWVVANPVPQLETTRLTLTAPILCRARHIVFLTAGARKAEALARVLEGPFDPERTPAQMIHPDAGELVWLVDREAAGKLKALGNSEP